MSTAIVKKVSAEQMDILFEFTRKHYVEYYDVQCELVDHLANAIEERWLTQPTLSFNEALHFEFKKFGIFGFTGIVEKRQAALAKKYNNLSWTYFKEFLRLPKIVLTLLFVVGAYQLERISMVAYTVVLFIIVIISLTKLVALNIKHHKKVKRTGRKWLFETLLMRSGGLMVAPYQISFYIYKDEPGMLWMWVMAILFTAFALFNYITLFVIPARAQEHLLKTYPEYNM